VSGSSPGRREVAYRLFAAEFDDAELSYSESDEERAPNYVVTPTGARVNRLFVVGVLTELEDVNPEMVRGRIVDPTGAFVTYAGQYQPDALAFLERADPPAFLAVSGKARTYEPDDGDRIYTSIRPEAVSEVDGETRDRWVVMAAERTRERIGVMASAIESGLVGDQLRAALVDAGVDDRLADGVTLALEHYGTTSEYLAELETLATDAVRVVADERDEVGQLDLAPGEGVGDASELATLSLPNEPTPETAAAAAGVTDEEPDRTESSSEPPEEPDRIEASNESSEQQSTEQEPTTDTDVKADTGSGQPTESALDIDTETSADAESGPESASEADVEPESEPTSAETETVSERDDEPTTDSDDFDPGEFELDDEERQAVEDEYGTEFSTADEVEPADIEPEVPNEPGTESDGEPSTVEAESAPTDATAEDDTDAIGDTEAGGDTAEPGAEGASEDADLDDVVVETMTRLDDGDGADEESVVSTIVDEHGVEPEAVSEAIQDALMSGQCYEPADGVLKPI
jgi:RPA family protein